MTNRPIILAERIVYHAFESCDGWLYHTHPVNHEQNRQIFILAQPIFMDAYRFDLANDN